MRSFSIDVEGEHVVPLYQAPEGFDPRCASQDNHDPHEWTWVNGDFAVTFDCPGEQNALTKAQQERIVRKAWLKKVRAARRASQPQQRSRRR